MKNQLRGLRFILLVTIGLFACIIFPYHARAQSRLADTPFRLQTSPLPINIVTAPGASPSAVLKVKNVGARAEQIKVGLLKFSAFGENGKPRLVEREKGDDYFDWVSFSQDSFELGVNETKSITATFNIPPEAAFGYYYAVTFSQDQPSQGSEPRQTSLVGSTAILVLVEVVVPNAKRDLEITEFSSSRKVYEFLPSEFVVKVRNKGNVHLIPQGNIFIDKGTEKDIAILAINPTKGNVLPASNRIFTTSWTDGFPVPKTKIVDNKVVTNKKGEPVTELKWDLSQADKLRFGKYTANLILAYDDGVRDQVLEGALTFWVIPWKMILVLIVLILFVFMGFVSTIRYVLGGKRRRR